MNYKELYFGTQNRRFIEITGIKKTDVLVEGKPIKAIKENWIIVLTIFAIAIAFLLRNFNATYFLVCMGLMILLTLLFIVGNSYSVKCEKQGLIITQGFRKNQIAYDRIKNVFVARTRNSFFVKTYVLVIRCEDNFSLLREFEYPLLSADINQVCKFIDNFKLATQSNSRYVKFEKKKSFRKIVENIATVTFVIIILWYMISTGIIKLF